MRILLLFFFGILSAIGFSQENWDYLPVAITNNYHGAICSINENVVHVVSDNGIFYKTENGGETWTTFDSGIQEFFLDIAFDGTNAGYAVGANGTILKTENAGQTWATINSGTTEALVAISVNAPNSIWTVGDNGTVLHSTDGGNSWVSNTSLTIENLNDVAFKDGNIGYIAGKNGTLLYTENGGDVWEVLAIPTTEDLSAITINEDFVYLLSGYANVYFSDYGFSGNAIYKSNNNIDWLHYQIEDFLSGASNMYFVNDDVGFIIASDALLCDCCFVYINKTTDGATSWAESYHEETNAANCNANIGYAKMDFPLPTVGYVLLGPHILKTPYEMASVADFNKDAVFTIYPNPTVGGKFTLKINDINPEDLSMEIVDITGKKIFFMTGLKENNTISLSNISEGIYFINLVKNGKKIFNQKLVLR